MPTKYSHAPHVDAVGVLDPGEHAHHPGLAEHAAAAEHEDVGWEGHRGRLVDVRIHLPG